MLELKIKKAENGYILEWEEELEEGYQTIVNEVMEEKYDEKQTMARLLERVAEYFGFGYNKFGKENLNIQWNRIGHKLV